MVLFLCHNCSDINSPSGEACVLRADISLKDRILLGGAPCVKGYTVTNELWQKELAEAGIISSDVFPVETDFYIIGSDEAERNFKKVMSFPLWEVTHAEYKLTEDQKRFEEEFEKRRAARRERELESDIQNANKFMDAICSQAAPINTHGMV